MNTWCDVVFCQQRNCWPRPMELPRSNHTSNMTARASKRTHREMKSKCCLSSSKKARLKDLRKRRNRAADTRWKECGGVECCTCRAVLPLRNAPREKTNKDNSFMLTSATERSDWIKNQICKRVQHLPNGKHVYMSDVCTCSPCIHTC